MTLKQIAEKWLKANGYSGLYNENSCGCVIGDLMPCLMVSEDCEAGHKVEYKGECPCGNDCNWHVQKTPEPIKIE